MEREQYIGSNNWADRFSIEEQIGILTSTNMVKKFKNPNSHTQRPPKFTELYLFGMSEAAEEVILLILSGYLSFQSFFQQKSVCGWHINELGCKMVGRFNEEFSIEVR